MDKTTGDLVQDLIDIVREEQKMRYDLQLRVGALESKLGLYRDVIVELPRLQAALTAKEN